MFTYLKLERRAFVFCCEKERKTLVKICERDPGTIITVETTVRVEPRQKMTASL